MSGPVGLAQQLPIQDTVLEIPAMNRLTFNKRRLSRHAKTEDSSEAGPGVKPFALWNRHHGLNLHTVNLRTVNPGWNVVLLQDRLHQALVVLEAAAEDQVAAVADRLVAGEGE